MEAPGLALQPASAALQPLASAEGPRSTSFAGAGQAAASQAADPAKPSAHEALREWFDEMGEDSDDDGTEAVPSAPGEQVDDASGDDSDCVITTPAQGIAAPAASARSSGPAATDACTAVAWRFRLPYPLAAVGPVHPVDAHTELADDSAAGSVWIPPVTQLVYTPTPAAPVAPAPAPAPTPAPAPVLYGFTNEQKETLRAQILAFKELKSGKMLSPDAWETVKPRPYAYGAAGEAMRASSAADAARRDAAARQAEAASRIAKQEAAKEAKARLAAAKVEKAQSLAQKKAKQQAMMDQKRAEGLKASEARLAETQAKAEREAKIRQHRPLLRPWRGGLYSLGPCQRDKTPAQFELHANLPALLEMERRRMLLECRTRVKRDIENALVGEGGFPRAEGTERTQLQLRLRKLRLEDLQTKIRGQVEAGQREVMRLNDRAYKKFQTDCKRFLMDADKVAQRKFVDLWGERVSSVKDCRSGMAQSQAMKKDTRTVLNRAVKTFHDRQRAKALKVKGNEGDLLGLLQAKEFEAFQQAQKQAKGSGGEDVRFQEISLFLTETEEYLNKLTAKVLDTQVRKEAEAAYEAAIVDARAAGMNEETAVALAKQAATEARQNSDAFRKESNLQADTQAKYYALAHLVDEQVSAPAMLKGPKGAELREYQMVGLQWMVSLYNNHLNGILADEMGLGKTVQVMALIAYLMEHKNNYGPHLIIVPNAVIVNWKSELGVWLPDVKCVYYTGTKEARAQIFKEAVVPLQFNCLVTTYELVMRDASKLKQVAWKYCVIDEAQRMKNRESKLARDLDKFQCERRLLLTGTPLQNELRELWSLLNLLLPDFFDDKKQFTKWFGDMVETLAGTESAEEQLIAKEKRVVIIHRLHEVLEPFMLRRQVEAVEGSLPEKLAITIKCPMTGYQGAIYDWVKLTSTVRMDPAGDYMMRYKKTHCALNNKVMELRKICNHPLLTYPPVEGSLLGWVPDERIITECGKMVFLDRLLVKFFRTGHRVLLFATMTKQLDLMEAYLKWRTIDGKYMQYRRIDGCTPLEVRESSIQQFNAPDSEVFIFLLSIRAAGRGLNLQTSDTVVIYDPDPNPKNEEQAIARSHRIGQTKTVRVIHLEAVADAPVDAIRGDDDDFVAPVMPVAPIPAGAGAVAQAANDVARNTTRYLDSVESIYRHVIQKGKNDMASEIIDAGRFDGATTMEERKETLEELLADEERSRVAKNEVPTWEWINRQLARSPAEVIEFERIDREYTWEPPLALDKSPDFIAWTAMDAHRVIALNAKPKRGQPKLGEHAQEDERRHALAMLNQQATGQSVSEYIPEAEAISTTGRKQRKAGLAAAQKIDDYNEWSTSNPYRNNPSGRPAPGAVPPATPAAAPSAGARPAAAAKGATAGAGGTPSRRSGAGGARPADSGATVSEVVELSDDNDDAGYGDDGDMEEEQEEDNLRFEEADSDEDAGASERTTAPRGASTPAATPAATTPAAAAAAAPAAVNGAAASASKADAAMSVPAGAEPATATPPAGRSADTATASNGAASTPAKAPESVQAGDGAGALPADGAAAAGGGTGDSSGLKRVASGQADAGEGEAQKRPRIEDATA